MKERTSPRIVIGLTAPIVVASVGLVMVTYRAYNYNLELFGLDDTISLR